MYKGRQKLESIEQAEKGGWMNCSCDVDAARLLDQVLCLQRI